MALEGCRLACIGPTGLRHSVSYMASQLGGTYSIDLHRCTHLVATTCRREPFGPWVMVVHPRWLTRCYQLHQRVPERHYEPTFYHAARRCGTRTRLGYPDIFWDEVGLFHMAEGHLSGLGTLLRGRGDMAVRSMPGWRAAAVLLQDTVFWGAKIREMNWRARAVVMMALGRPERPERRRYMRRCSDGPAHVLRDVAPLPDILIRYIVEYL